MTIYLFENEDVEIKRGYVHHEIGTIVERDSLRLDFLIERIEIVCFSEDATSIDTIDLLFKAPEWKFEYDFTINDDVHGANDGWLDICIDYIEIDYKQKKIWVNYHG